MRRTRERTAGDLVALTVTLDRSQVESLDGLVKHLGVSRQEVLTRGLFVLDVTHLLMAAPSDAKITVGLSVPGAWSPWSS